MNTDVTGPQPGPPAGPARLRAIVSVPESSRVQCQETGCGRSVYAAVHIVEDAGHLLILGSGCFANRYGSLRALGAAVYGSGAGKRLTDAERLLLLENTHALLEQFRQEELAKVRQASPIPPKLAAALPPSDAPPARATPAFQPTGNPPKWSSPWHWQKALTSILLMQAPSGERWIRVQHQDGSQKLVPWPRFSGWDMALPAGIGTPDHALGVMAVADIATALARLRAMGFKDRVGDRKDVLGKGIYQL